MLFSNLPTAMYSDDILLRFARDVFKVQTGLKACCVTLARMDNAKHRRLADLCSTKNVSGSALQGLSITTQFKGLRLGSGSAKIAPLNSKRFGSRCDYAHGLRPTSLHDTVVAPRRESV